VDRAKLIERLSELAELARRVCDGAAWDSEAAELERGLSALVRDIGRSSVRKPPPGRQVGSGGEDVRGGGHPRT
jgi:hypothetical protein